jgi:adenine-specific DNA-methyltransferase
MKLITQTPKKVLKGLLKQKPLRSEIDVFKTNLITLLDKISVIEKRPKDESEEHLKNDLRDFLRDTYYRDTNAINTKDKKDLVIHLDKSTNSEVGIIIEAKRPTNISEMVTADNPNKKALHEIILYYLDERNKGGNNQLKQLIVTNVHEWFIIDANYFDKHIYRNTQIKKLYDTKINDKKDNPFFYEEIAKIISKLDIDIPCTYFDIREYDKILRNNKKEDDRELIALLKILSPQHLLKITTPNDSNSLNEKFYKELLHIIGLEEAKENGKNIIRRKKESRFAASLIEGTIEALNTEDPFHRLPDQSIYGENKEERAFNISLELCITWINRILFLKLLEGQLITYHQGNKDFRFLNSETINDFDELFKLFHKVLAVNLKDRSEAIRTKYSQVPYLNSSLFEISELEDQTIKINSLDNSGKLEILGTTILKDAKKKVDTLPTLNYLFQFLDAYDFASEGAEDVQEDNKTIINASVLGKVFEKINGYKEGSVFTPAFITMYMCKQSIRLAVIEKFNEIKKWNIELFEELYNKIDDKKEANEIINSIKICDPAVGSGHFLVSALNEIIALKSELGILIDEKGKTLRDYNIEIVNDELIITDENGGIIFYNPKNIESNRVQKTLFQEKQTIIENCLFGVDINPNSVKICRLRLWIELLKNAYYKSETDYTELETLPNIDINIKCGNSLLSRFPLDADLSKALKSIKYDVKAYRGFVNDYKNEKSRDVKRGLQKIIDSIKGDFRTEISNNDAKQVKLSKLSGELFTLQNQGQIFELTPKEKKAKKEKQTKVEADITKISKEIEEIKNNTIYKNAFEWRFEFPEVINNKGDFEGFDLIIGNPPYIRHEEIKHLKPQLEKDFTIFNSSADILTYFFELGNNILRPKGIMSLIVSNKFFKVSYGDNLRSYLIQNTLLQQIIEFDKVNIFDEATVKAAIIQLKKEKLSKTFTYLDVSAMPENLEATVKEEGKEYEQALFNKGQWIFQGENLWNIFNKISEYGKALSDWDLEIYRGLLTGLNEAFLIDEATKDRLISEDKNAERIIKPLFRGRETEKYFSKSSPSYIIATFPSLKLEIEKYPSIENHLLTFGKEKLEQSGKPGSRKKTSNKWFETQDATAYWSEFEKPKLVWKRIGSRLRFSYDESGTYTLDSTCIATGKYLKYLVGVLNSKLIENELNRFAPKTGTGDLIISVQALSPLQIPIPTPEQEIKIIELVDKIIVQKQIGEDTKTNETLIDQMVYELYHITPDEQKLIEGT